LASSSFFFPDIGDELKIPLVLFYELKIPLSRGILFFLFLTRIKYVGVIVTETMKRKILFSITSLFVLSAAFLTSPRSSYAVPFDPLQHREGVFGDPWQIIAEKKQDVAVFVGEALPTALASGISSILTGCNLSEMTKKDGCTAKDPLKGYLPGGAFGYMAIAFDEIQNGDNILPINLAYYSQDLASNLPLGIVNPPSAYAEAELFKRETSGLAKIMSGTFRGTVLELWKTMRNIAYSLIVLILVIVGFMVMFRKKLSAQVTVSVANSLPRLVIGLILITFSYPIAALTIPFMNALLAMSTGLFQNALTERFGEMNMTEMAVESLNQTLSSGNWEINLFIGILTVVLIVAFFIAMLSVLFTLAQRYLKIIIATIFGPLILAAGILPGQEKLTSDWIKGLIINTVSVPAIFAIFFIGLIIIIPVQGYQETEPTQIAHVLKWVVGLGIMLQARKAPGAIATAFKAPEMWVPSVGTAKKKG